jgi:hypothetical protein
MQKKVTKVSVCVITYNQEKYICQSFQNIMDQEVFGDELFSNSVFCRRALGSDCVPNCLISALQSIYILEANLIYV